MTADEIPPEIAAEIMRLRLAERVPMAQLATRFNYSTHRIKMLVGNQGCDVRTIKANIAKTIHANPCWTDAEVAESVGCPVALVTQRRPIAAQNSWQALKNAGDTLEDWTDRGAKYRIPAHWCRVAMGQWERSLYQARALLSGRFTLEEIRLSCIAAGLEVKSAIAIGKPGTKKVEPKETRFHERVSHRRIKVGTTSNWRRRGVRN